MTLSKGPNFLVVGLEKSGTHWVTALLNAHPEVACFPALPFYSESGGFNNIVGEVHLFNTLASLEPGTEGRFTRPLSNYLNKHGKIFADLVAYQDKLPKDDLYQLFINRYNELCDSQRNGKLLVGESTPAYVFHLEFIDRFYPGIKKLCIIRDPKDRVVSWHFNELRKKRKTEEEISDEFVREYCINRIQREYEALLAYERSIHCFTYESLTHYAKKVLREALEYLGVEKIDEHILDNMIMEGSFERLTAIDSKGKGRERGEESRNSQYRKGIVNDWKNYLTVSQSNMVDGLTKSLQKEVFKKYKVYEHESN